MNNKIIFVFILLIMLFCITGCNIATDDSFIQNMTTKVVFQTTSEVFTTVAETTEEPTEQITENVKTADDYISTYKQLSGYDNTYRIPKILIEGNDADMANQEILEIYGGCFENTENLTEYCFGTDYLYYLNGNVLSVIVWSESMNQYCNYKVYNFDVATNTRLYNEDIVKLLSLDYEDIKAKIKTILSDDFSSRYSLLEQDDMYNEQYNKSIADSNIAESELYIGENGKLMAKCMEYSLVGSGQYYYLFEIQ